MEKINHNLLELARTMRGLSQKEAASAIGISQGKLSKAELGVQELTSETLEKVSEVYRLPLSFFFSNEEKTPTTHLHFRRKLTISRKSIDSFIAIIQFLKMAIDNLMKSFEFPEYSLPSIEVTDENGPVEIAQEIRFLLKLQEAPIPNLTNVLENAGILILKFDFGVEQIDGVSTITDEGHRIIFLNSAQPPDKMRFSLAHELGHLIMHFEVKTNYPDEIENQAHAFASELLFPISQARAYLPVFSFPTMLALKKKWGISMRAIAQKSKYFNLIDPESFRNLQKAFSKNGYTKKEPGFVAPENPTIIHKAIDLFQSELDYTLEEVLEIMNISDYSDYHEWFCTSSPIVFLNRLSSQNRQQENIPTKKFQKQANHG